MNRLRVDDVDGWQERVIASRARYLHLKRMLEHAVESDGEDALRQLIADYNDAQHEYEWNVRSLSKARVFASKDRP